MDPDMLTETLASAFSPFEALARTLLPHAADTTDGSHDLAHILRVFRNAERIRAREGGDGEVLAAAVLLHDCVAVEKNDPRRAEASCLAGEKAAGLLAGLNWPADRIDSVRHAIEAHSFSANIAPRTLEARILQDADRLDAIGMIGVARCFYIGGRLGSSLYEPADPAARDRDLDDKRFAIDHFPVKLFKLADGFQTVSGREMAKARDERIHLFYDLLLEEI
jgi:uncharacterized protein